MLLAFFSILAIGGQSFSPSAVFGRFAAGISMLIMLVLGNTVNQFSKILYNNLRCGQMRALVKAPNLKSKGQLSIMKYLRESA